MDTVKTKPYAKIHHDGTWMVCQLSELDVNITDLEPGEFLVEIVEMTDEEFEALPEFNGW